MAYGQFTANLKQWNHFGHITPNIEVSDGIRPDYFYPAPWLPTIRHDLEWEVYFSLTAGQIVTLDLDGHVVPKGMTTVTYGTNDIGEVYNISTGALVTQDDLDNDGDGSTATYTISSYTRLSPYHIGIMPYNAFAWYGGVIVSTNADGTYSFECDPNRPVYERYTNFNVQSSIAILCDRYIQVPWIGTSESGYTTQALSYAHAYGSIATRTDFDVNGKADGYFYPGCFVVSDSKGMYIPYDSSSHSSEDIVGQLLKVDSRYPRNYLERVHTFDAKGQFGTMDQMPGTATRGMDYQIHIPTDGAYRAAIDAGNTPADATKTMFKINLIYR